MGLPRWPEQPYDDIVAAAVAELLIKDPEHDYAKDLLRGKFED